MKGRVGVKNWQKTCLRSFWMAHMPNKSHPEGSKKLDVKIVNSPKISENKPENPFQNYDLAIKLLEAQKKFFCIKIF